VIRTCWSLTTVHWSLITNSDNMEIGFVGKPNVGKSTMFSAATLAPAQIANYPFTTIEPNRGAMFVRTKCPCADFKIKCEPQNSHCEDGVRFVPVRAIDVAGLVPDAHKGKGLGVQFLDDLRQADALVHVIDAAGSTNIEGVPCNVGEHDPMDDVRFLEREIAYWMHGIISKDMEKMSRAAHASGKTMDEMLAEKLAGLGITHEHIAKAHSVEVEIPEEDKTNDLLVLCYKLRKIGKPMIIAANKSDIAPPENIAKLQTLKDYIVIPTSAESELALRHAAKAGLIKYKQGDSDFQIIEPSKLNEKQTKALEYIREHVLKKYGSTGIQKCIETAVFQMLDYITIFPVEDEHKLTNKDGQALPDAKLVKQGTTAKEFAFKIHTDLGNKFIRAIDARTKMIIGADHVLKDCDVVKIVAAR